MGDDSDESTNSNPLDILADIRASESAWADDWPDADHVGKIRDVKIHDPDVDLDEIADRLRNIKSDARNQRPTGRHTRADKRWKRFRDLASDIKSELEMLSETAVIVVIELPDGSRFIDLFELPTTSSDAFYKLCADGLDIDPGTGSVLSEHKITGQTVPLTRYGRRWRIDMDHIIHG